jgi:hypothetical protein
MERLQQPVSQTRTYQYVRRYICIHIRICIRIYKYDVGGKDKGCISEHG